MWGNKSLKRSESMVRVADRAGDAGRTARSFVGTVCIFVVGASGKSPHN